VSGTPSLSSARESREDPITRDLIVRIRRDRAIRDSPLWVISQFELLTDVTDRPVVPVGYLDIAIQFLSGSSKLCLAIECKRLNVARKNGRRVSLSGEYVRQGMMRFVSGQYSPDLSLGGMIGYVMDGNVEGAYLAIRKQIEIHASELLCDLSQLRELILPEYFSTEHGRFAVPIELRHLLLSVV
jgi:hypothetical protein